VSDAKPPEFRAETIDFVCPGCKRTARVHPQERPIAVQHSLPECEDFLVIKGNADAVFEYLRIAGINVARTN
jgi:hypothetical protein